MQQKLSQGIYIQFEPYKRLHYTAHFTLVFFSLAVNPSHEEIILSIKNKKVNPSLKTPSPSDQLLYNYKEYEQNLLAFSKLCHEY